MLRSNRNGHPRVEAAGALEEVHVCNRSFASRCQIHSQEVPVEQYITFRCLNRQRIIYFRENNVIRAYCNQAKVSDKEHVPLAL